MSRRSGQNGRIEKKGKFYHARFWLDVPGKAKRVYKSVRICPVNGPGSLNKFELKRRAKEIIAEFDANSETIAKKTEAINLGTTFRAQAQTWLQTVQTRKRNPIKPRTACNVLRRSLHRILKDLGREKSGFHGFRRFRITHLRKQRVMEVLLRIWVGHSTHGITDNYTVESIKADVEFRSLTAEQSGLGFHIPVVPKLPDAPALPKCTHVRSSQLFERIGRGERI